MITNTSRRQTTEQNQTRFLMAGTADGDLPIQMTAVVVFEGRQVVSNSAKIMDPKSGALVCDGKVSNIDQGYLAATCEGAGPYSGLHMVLDLQVRTYSSGNFTGTVTADVRQRGQSGDGDGD